MAPWPNVHEQTGRFFRKFRKRTPVYSPIGLLWWCAISKKDEEACDTELYLLEKCVAWLDSVCPQMLQSLKNPLRVRPCAWPILRKKFPPGKTPPRPFFPPKPFWRFFLPPQSGPRGSFISLQFQVPFLNRSESSYFRLYVPWKYP